MIEVTANDDSFAPSLFRFHAKLTTAQPYPIVYDLNRKNPKAATRKLPAHEFLRDFQLM